MRRHAVNKVLGYDPDDLFALVGDVERYPEFVPWLTGIRTWNAHEIEPGVSCLDAEAAVGFSVLRESFATRVVRDANSRHIGVNLLRGPFNILRNDWRFLPHAHGAIVEFSIEFEFKTRLLDAFLAANIDRAVDKLIARFESRACVLFGGKTKV